jgi:multiple sugar transport system permease protein
MKKFTVWSAATVAADRTVWASARFARKNQLTPYIWLAPVVVPLAFYVLYPIISILYLSSQRYLINRPNDIQFIGLANYLQLLTDQELWRSLEASGIWVAGSVIPQFLLGLGMALLLNELFPGRDLVRTLILMPWVLSGVVTAIMWVWLFDGTIGVINDMLMKVGLVSRPVAWAIRPTTSFLMLFVANAWRGAPFFAVTLLAALQGISIDIYEAAEIDGASRWQRFRHITLPLIANTIIVSTLLRAIWTFNWVDLIWTMTKGGPLNSTRTVAMYVFDTAYLDGNFGYAATLSIALCFVLILFSALYWRLNRFVVEV